MKLSILEGKTDGLKYELPSFDEVGKNMVARDIGETARYYAGKVIIVALYFAYLRMKIEVLV